MKKALKLILVTAVYVAAMVALYYATLDLIEAAAPALDAGDR